MTLEQKHFLSDNLHIWEEYKQTETVKHYDMAFRNRLYEIARNIDPNYIENMWCNECAANVMKFVYTQYEKEFVFPDDLDTIPAQPIEVRTEPRKRVKK